MHESEASNVEKGVELEHQFEVALETNSFSDEKYNLYRAYQSEVHKETPLCSKEFNKCFCDSPFTIRPQEIGRAKHLLGSYHQCYRLDRKLIAIGVLDILPQGVSRNYFMYDPEYKMWGLGKLGALREIGLAKECQLQYYYMGDYTPQCEKLQYKLDFKPQYVLNMESFSWEQVSESREKAKGWSEGLVRLEEKRFHSAVKAYETAMTGVPLFQVGFAGVVSVDEIKRACGSVKLRLNGGDSMACIVSFLLYRLLLVGQKWEANILYDYRSIPGGTVRKYVAIEMKWKRS